MLPNLSKLSCVPCGMRISRWDERGLEWFVTQAGDEMANRLLAGGLTPVDDDGDATECVICQEPLNGPYEGQQGASKEVVAIVDGHPGTCGHVFHTECLRKQVSSGQASALLCAVCRQPFEMSIFNSVINVPGGPTPEPVDVRRLVRWVVARMRDIGADARETRAVARAIRAYQSIPNAEARRALLRDTQRKLNRLSRVSAQGLTLLLSVLAALGTSDGPLLTAVLRALAIMGGVQSFTTRSLEEGGRDGHSDENV